MSDKFSIPFDSLRKGINDSRELLPKFREIFYALEPEVNALSEYIEATERELNSPPPVTIALLGSTGAGKSTLINRIVGADVLPNSGSRVCTAGITRLKFADTDNFKVTVQITDEEYWKQEVKALISTIESESSSSTESNGALTREERERFIAVYGLEALEGFLVSKNYDELRLPPKVSEAFRQKTFSITAQDSKEVLEIAKKYLVTTNFENQNFESDQLWPIVESVLIEGRFDAIKHGSEIVDLPGVNDPNPAREAKTWEYLKVAKFVFIAYEAKRQPTKDIREVLKSRDLMSTIIATGKTHALTFVATKVDQFSEDDQDFAQFPEDATMESFALHRKRLISESLRTALQEIAREVSEGAPNPAEKLSIYESIAGSKTFITSAQDYAFLTKREAGHKLRTPPKFEHVSDTEIPALRAHVDELTLRVGPSVIFSRIHNQVSGISHQMQMILNLEFAKFIMQNQSFTEKSAALQARVTEITKEFESILLSLSKDFNDAVTEKSKDFFLRIGKGQNAAPRIQREMTNFLRGLHWTTARATTARGGEFFSNSRGWIDLAGEVATPIIDTITHPWSEFFGTSLQDIIDILQVHLTKGVDDFVVKIRHTVSDQNQVESLEQVLTVLLKNVDEVAQSRIQDAKVLLAREIETTRSSLVEIIQNSVRIELKPVFHKASEEAGTGMKQRMIDRIIDAVGDAVPQAFANAHDVIQATVIESNTKVLKLIDDMTAVLIKDGTKVESIFARLENKEKPFDEVKANELRGQIATIVSEVASIEMQKDSLPDTVIEIPSKPFIYLDGSNVATVTSLTKKKIASLEMLLSCKQAIEHEFPGHTLVVFVDAKFKFDLPEQEQKKFDALELEGSITRTPGGIPADSVILKNATLNKGRIVSRDRYRDWMKSYPIINEPGRIIAPTYVPASKQWFFNSRTRP